MLPLLALVAAGCSDDDVTEPEPAPLPPVVTGYSADTVVPGDTIEVTGSRFATQASSNRIKFANRLAVVSPFFASETSLMVEVPENAATGPVSVTVSGQSQAGVGPDLTVTRALGEVWAFAGYGDGEALRLRSPSPGAEYLVVPHATNASILVDVENTYGITGERVQQALARGVGAAPAEPLMTVRERFDRHLRRELERLAASRDGTVPLRPKAALPSRAPAQFRSFNVLNTAVGSAYLAANYDQVTAMLRYNGQHCLIYSDVDTLAAGNLTQADFRNFGQRFDTQIHPSNTTYFGTESDIDGNGKVIILISGVINGLPKTDPSWVQNPEYFIGGFFLATDLFRPPQLGLQENTSNEAEIFYMLAADPDGEYLGAKFKFPTQFVAEENVRTLAHEYQHLISMSHRIFTYGLAYVQKTWLEEGMAHMAEDLFSRTSGDADMNSSNVDRADSFLTQPDTTSLEHDSAPLRQRGGIYLFLRYLGDRFGVQIYKGILQSKCLGRACIEAITGENFYDTVGDFLATLYLSGRGITDDDRYNFSSIDLADFVPLRVRSRPADSVVSGTVKRTSGEYYLFINPTTAESRFVLTQGPRAGIRVMVVRTK
jgi:hypothetical protein